MLTIATPAAPAAIGPYSQAKVAGGFLFTAGQIPLDPATMEMVGGGIEAQTERVLDNLAAVLAEAGSRWDRYLRAVLRAREIRLGRRRLLRRRWRLRYRRSVVW